MPALEDPDQIPYLRTDSDLPTNELLGASFKPETLLLKDGQTIATFYPIFSPDEVPDDLMEFLWDELNAEIERGDTYPMDEPLALETFRPYWFGAFGAVLAIGDEPTLQAGRDWPKQVLGTFYVKPNYPGRCSHVCNAGFLVNGGIRGQGIGRTMGLQFLKWAPKLGYAYSVFNLVFDSNEASKRIWDSLGFDRIGKVKGAGRLKGYAKPVDAIIYGKELI